MKPETIKFNNSVYYNVAQAARMMFCSESTVNREINKRNIEVFNHPKGALISPQAIAEWIDRKTIKARKRND